MGPLAESHHHRNTTKAANKAFKSRHLTKSALKERSKGKIEDSIKSGRRRTINQQVMSKLERRNQAKQLQQAKQRQHTQATSVFSGKNGAPRIVVIVSLCKDGDLLAALQSINSSLDLAAELPAHGLLRVDVERFKQKVEYVLPKRELLAVLEACRVSDFIIFVLSPEQEVDELGELMLRSIQGQGVPNVLTVVQSLDSVQPAKRRQQLVSSLKLFITHFFPLQDKVHSLDSRQECSNLIRSLCTTTPKGIKWREERSWMLVEEIQQTLDHKNESDKLVITGSVRGKPWKADRLVQLGTWGQFQIEKIVAAPQKLFDKQMQKPDGDEEPTILDIPTPGHDDLAELAPEEARMDDADKYTSSLAPSERRGVLLDDHHYFEDDETHIPPPPKKLPKGTSSYQSAWFLDDVSDSESDVSDAGVSLEPSMDPPALPQDGMEGLEMATQGAPTETAPSEAGPSEMFLDHSPEDEADQIAAFRSRAEEGKEDLEFPDEIELHPNVLARERLARYRGLKSLRTSNWETEEDKAHEPEVWSRLLQIPDYKRARSQVTREALVGGAPTGSRVDIYLRGVSSSFSTAVNPPLPISMISLLRHERKHTVLNFIITLASDYPSPLKSKEPLILQVGSRYFVINPLFSQPGHTRNNVHKFDRYLHPGRTAIATFIGPLTWGSVPALFYRPTSDPKSPLTLIGTGTALPPDSDRVIAKRIILTGHPYKIHKKLVTVRYMFFNAEDVQWFKALQLFTKRGRSGFIKESLGTHGYFKATFDGRINPQDSVGVSLYKRMWPRQARPWRGENIATEQAEEGMEVEDEGGVTLN